MSTLFLSVVYKMEHIRLISYEKKVLSQQLAGFNYDISMMIDRDGLRAVVEYLDITALTHDLIFSLSLVRDNTIILSSKRPNIGKNISFFHPISCLQLDLEHSCKNHITIEEQIQTLGNNNKYSLLVELDCDALRSYLQGKLSIYIIIIVTTSVVSMLFFIILLYKLFINPIKRINEKVQNETFIPSNFLLKEIDKIDRELMLNMQELHHLNKSIEEQSYIDDLTKVYNRKAYNKRIEEFIAQYNRYNTTFCVLMYDIDDFKLINDKFGHQTGDKVLVQMSRLVATVIRENDYLFRVGGEEFVILLTKTALDDAVLVAQKIRLAVIQDLHTIKDTQISISIGVTEMQTGDTEDKLYKRADNLLYKAKNEGKNRVFF